ncbi:MAG: TOBE domain-containing protein, partial [Rhizobium sp.]|nr:TOBE domain-containing protein [Rhizobium sp.]
AMTLADRIVVLRDGRVEQVGSPRQIYEDPDNLFVAGFIGSPRMNLLKATKQDDTTVSLAGTRLQGLPQQATIAKGAPLWFGIRPEHMALCQPHEEGLSVRVEFTEYLGSTRYLYGTLEDGQSLIAELRDDQEVADGATIRLAAPVERYRVFDETGRRLRR